MMSDWKVELVNDNINELYVEFKGPKESEHWPFVLICPGCSYSESCVRQCMLFYGQFDTLKVEHGYLWSGMREWYILIGMLLQVLMRAASGGSM